jgi:hypothetical protein
MLPHIYAPSEQSVVIFDNENGADPFLGEKIFSNQKAR